MTISLNTPYTTFFRLLDIYRDFAGNDNLIALSNGALSTVDPDMGTKVDRYTLGGANKEGWKADSYGKAWICNGSAVVKMESDKKVYPVGIAAPVGSTMQIVSETDSPLTKGTYGVIVSYARRIPATSKVLYSKGEAVDAGGGNFGTIAVEYDNQSIEITIPASSDIQVNDKIVWVKRPNDAVHYYFAALGDVEQTITLTSDMVVDATKIYESTALYNGQPPQGATFIFAFADRLWLIKENVIYYSNKGKFNDLDLEVFEPANYVTTAYNLTGIFSDGQNLCFNTTEGILLMPNADPNAILYLTEPRWHFKYMRTCARWNNGTIGLTNDGMRIFSDGKFNDFDLAYPIKSKVDKAYQASANFQPCGYVYRRSFRSEYHLLWQDPSLGTTINNIHAILNLDSMFWDSPVNNNLAWEFQPYSGNYAVVGRESNQVYVAQSHVSAPTIYREAASDQSIGVYTQAGTLLTANTSHRMTLRTRTMLLSSHATCWLEKIYLLAQFTKAFTVRAVVTDRRARIATDNVVAVNTAGNAVYDTAVFDQDIYPYNDVDVQILKFPDALRGKTFYLEFEQTDNDPNFQLMSALLKLVAETGNFL